jgi:hypothetical protein
MGSSSRNKYMNYDIAYCDLHPLFAMAPTTIGLLSACGDHSTFEAGRCTGPNCNRHYTPDFGYFYSEVGRLMDLGDMSQKPRCGCDHEFQAMVLTHVDGVLKWICPVAGCHTMLERSIPVDDFMR